MNKASDVQELIAAQEIRPLIAVTRKLLGENYSAELETMFANLLYEGLPESESPENLQQLDLTYKELQEKEENFVRFVYDMLSVLKDKEFLDIFSAVKEDKKFIEQFILELESACRQHIKLVHILNKECERPEDRINNIKEAYEAHFSHEAHIILSAMFDKLDSLMNVKYKQKVDQYAEKKIAQINKDNELYKLSFSKIPKEGAVQGKIYAHKKDEDNITVTLLNLQGTPVSFDLPISIEAVKEDKKTFRAYIIDEAVKKGYAKKEEYLNSNSDKMIVRVQDTPKKFNSQFSTQYTVRRGMLLEAFYKHVEKTDENKSKLETVFRAVNKTRTVSNRAASGEMKQLVNGEDNHKIVARIQAKVKSNKVKELVFHMLKHVWAVINFDTLPPDIRSRKPMDFSKTLVAMKGQIKNSLSELKRYLESRAIGDFSKDGVLDQEAIEKHLRFIREITQFINVIDELSFKDTISRIVEVVDIAIENQTLENIKEESPRLENNDKESGSESEVKSEGGSGSGELVVTEEGPAESDEESEGFESEATAEEESREELTEAEKDEEDESKTAVLIVESNVEGEGEAEFEDESEKDNVGEGCFRKDKPKNFPYTVQVNPAELSEDKVEESPAKKVKPQFFTCKSSFFGFHQTKAVNMRSVIHLCKENNAAALFILAQAAYIGDGMKKNLVTAYYAALLALETTNNHNDHLKIMTFIKRLSVPKENMKCESIDDFNAESFYNNYIVNKPENNDLDRDPRKQFVGKTNALSDKIDTLKSLCAKKDPMALYLLAQAAHRGDGVKKDLVAAYYLALLAFKETKLKDSQEKIIKFLHKLPVPDEKAVYSGSLKIKVGQGELDPKQFYEQEKKASVAVSRALSV